MKYQRISSFFVTHSFSLLLFLIIVVAVWFRFAHLSGFIWEMVGYDESRDMLVAKHITNFGEHIWRGPLVAGGFNVLKNSPFYYYFIAALWFIGRSPLGVMYVWAFLTVVVVVLGYRIGVNIWDRWTGLWIAVLLAVHPNLINLSKQIGQPNLLPLWIVLLIWNLTRKKQMNFFDLHVNIGLLFLALHIHYGSLIIIPVCYVWILWVWWKRNTIKGKLVSIVTPFLISEYVVLVWIFLTYKAVPFDQIIFFQLNAVVESVSRYQIFLSIVKQVAALVWTNIDSRISVLSIMGSMLLVYIWSTRKQVHSLFREHIRFLIACCIVPILLFSIYIGHVSPTYVLSLIPIYLIILGIAIRILIKKQCVVGVLLGCVIVCFFANSAYRLSRNIIGESFYTKNRFVAEAIYRDYIREEGSISKELKANQDTVPSFRLMTFSMFPYMIFDGWAPSSVWYWLEEFFQLRLVSIDSSENNFTPRVESPKYLYVICDHRDTGRDSSDICLQRFVDAVQNVSKTYNVVYVSPTYTVWRFEATKVQSNPL